MLRFVNLISGSGSTNLSILQAESNGGKLHGTTETVAIISSSPDAVGIQKAIMIGFTEEDILIVDPDKRDLANQLLKILDHYQPDYFHQLGWMPRTSPEVLQHYQGLNQHLGPGGRWMYGVRRVYAHMRFCEMIGEERPIAVFCQYVDSEYDEGYCLCRICRH
jgi:folate-dependent phosphoribosylglycinamide formyltransferase PurN